MNNYFRFSSFKIILTFVCLAMIGIAFIPQLTVKLSPSKSLPQLSVSFSMDGISPLVIETEVTSKLEAMLGRMEGINKISSFSGNGWGEVRIELDKTINAEEARFEAATIVRQAWRKLPQGVSYPSVSLSGIDENFNRPFLFYTLTANESFVEIQEFAEKQIKPSLGTVKGIYRVEISEATSKEWRMEYDYNQLINLSVSIEEIRTAVNNYLKNESLGITTVFSPAGEEQRLGVMYIANMSGEITKDELDNIEINKIDEHILYLKDVVTIRRGEAPPDRYYRINGNNSVSFSITADGTANQLKLAKEIKTKLSEMEQDFPEEYELYLSYDASEYIKKELNKIYFRSGLTLLILLLFVIFLYRSIKYILLICCSLFINLAVAVIFYYFFNLELQLYSLAGITISLTLLIDNIIVMSDQIIHRRNKKAFLAILAATLTTISSLIIIFFLEEKVRLSLEDFALIIIINLFLSIFIALFLVPALIEKLNITPKKETSHFYKFIQKLVPKYHKNRMLVYFNRAYTLVNSFLWKRRIFMVIGIILIFGLPVFLLPDKVDGDTRFAEIYNRTLGTKNYKENIKPYVDIYFGGTWRLFTEKVYNGSYWTDRGEETSLYVTATLPHGSTLEQMDSLIKQMEEYIAKYFEVKQFETNVFSANRASIEIRFKESYQKGEFPYILKSRLITKSLAIGGGGWRIYGVGEGFNNDIKESAGAYRIEMSGYNYDELCKLAEEFRNNLLKNRRIKDVTIAADFSWYKDDYQEFYFNLHQEKLAKEGISPYQLYSSVKPFFEKRIHLGEFIYENKKEQLFLTSRQSIEYSIWELEQIPLRVGEKQLKLSELAIIDKYQAPQKIGKENQQYRVCIQYEYIGHHELGRKELEKYIKEMGKNLPIGYTIKKDEFSNDWGKDNNSQYWLLGLIFIIIYFCSTILFNSFQQPLYIIFIIPISFIGIFLTFYLFKLNFDQGGFAAFILLCGLTVNANIYIINEYNNIRIQRSNLSPQQVYLKAWNAKVRPIFLTVISTILGFIPFLIGDKEGFWFPLAAGAIGGLIVSFMATFFFLPLLMGKEICCKKDK